mgnify:CR=1 FL=1
MVFYLDQKSPHEMYTEYDHLNGLLKHEGLLEIENSHLNQEYHVLDYLDFDELFLLNLTFL